MTVWRPSRAVLEASWAILVAWVGFLGRQGSVPRRVGGPLEDYRNPARKPLAFDGKRLRRAPLVLGLNFSLTKGHGPAHRNSLADLGRDPRAAGGGPRAPPAGRGPRAPPLPGCPRPPPGCPRGEGTTDRRSSSSSSSSSVLVVVVVGVDENQNKNDHIHDEYDEKTTTDTKNKPDNEHHAKTGSNRRRRPNRNANATIKR